MYDSCYFPMFLLDTDISLHHALNTHNFIDPVNIGNIVYQSSVVRPIFVIGSPRSGTTLIGNCLNMSDELGGGEESLLLLDMWRIYSDLHKGNNKNNFSPLSKYISAEDLFINIKLFVDFIFSSPLQKKQRYIDQTPWYALIIKFVHALFPDAIFIHMIRDGREVVNSLEKSYSNGFIWAGKDLKERATIWVKSISSAQHYVGSRSDISYKEFRYDDLWNDPLSTIKAIADFCCIDYHTSMLRHLCVPHATRSEYDDIIGCCNNDGDIVFNKRRNVHKIVNRVDKDIFNNVAGELQIALGYDLY